MRKVFMCSLCQNGVLGGALYLESQSVIYRTQKLTVIEKYRNLVMPLKDIKEIKWKRMIFPIAIFHMENGEKYKIMIFNKTRFMKCYQEYNAN